MFAVNEIFNAWFEDGAKILNQFDLVFINMTRLWGFLGLIAQDVDGFLFVFWNVFYNERITNTVTIAVIFSYYQNHRFNYCHYCLSSK